ELGVVGCGSLDAARDAAVERDRISVIDNDRQSVVTEVAAIDGELGETGAEVLHKGRGAVVHEQLARGELLSTQREVVDEAALGVVKVAPFGVNLTPNGAGLFSLPVTHQDQIGRDLVQRLKEVREGVRRRLLQREDADEIVVEAQVAAVTLDG